MVSHSKTTANSNKTKWIPTPLKVFKKNPIKDWKEQIHQPGGKIYVFRTFGTPKSSILKQLETKTYVFKTL